MWSGGYLRPPAPISTIAPAILAIPLKRSRRSIRPSPEGNASEIDTDFKLQETRPKERLKKEKKKSQPLNSWFYNSVCKQGNQILQVIETNNDSRFPSEVLKYKELRKERITVVCEL